ncbi:MAG: hypothetical protein WBM71_16315 [Sedimenticolaceae bacterium]|jgi:hypothetical protein
MSNDNVLPFPKQFRDAVDDEAWLKLQGEFYLDCYFAQHGKPAENPEVLREWLTESQLFADTENPFFRGWLVRRLSEPDA